MNRQVRNQIESLIEGIEIVVAKNQENRSRDNESRSVIQSNHMRGLAGSSYDDSNMSSTALQEMNERLNTL